MAVNLLHLNAPFTFPVKDRSDFLLALRARDPDILLVGDQRLPFKPADQSGIFGWVTQNASGSYDRYYIQKRFLHTMRVLVQSVPAAGVGAFPPTPKNTECSLELNITPA